MNKLNRIKSTPLNMTKVGMRVKSLREAQNLTQKELAEKLNVTEKTIIAFENGKIRKGFTLLLNLTQALKTTADYILFLKEK